MTESKDSFTDEKRKDSRTLFEASRRILLAAIGTISLAQDEAEEFIDRLVERGEIAEKDGRQLMKELIEKRKIHRREIATEVNQRLKDLLDQINIPTRDDINELSIKIADLTQMVEDLKNNKK